MVKHIMDHGNIYNQRETQDLPKPKIKVPNTAVPVLSTFYLSILYIYLFRRPVSPHPSPFTQFIIGTKTLDHPPYPSHLTTIL